MNLQNVYIADAENRAVPLPENAVLDVEQAFILKAETLATGYGPHTVLENVTFQLAKGEVLGIIGQNGSGKSTLLKTLVGLLPVKSGKLTFGGSNVRAIPPHKLTASGISFFPQKGLIMPTLTVEEHLTLAAHQSGNSRTGHELAYTHFPRLRKLNNHRAGSLSGGERQMLSFAILTCQNTQTWLLDEPTAGLAPEMVSFTIEFLQKKKREEGITMLLVEHNMNVAFALADHIVVAKEGSLTRKFNKVEFQHSEFITTYVYHRFENPP